MKILTTIYQNVETATPDHIKALNPSKEYKYYTQLRVEQKIITYRSYAHRDTQLATVWAIFCDENNLPTNTNEYTLGFEDIND